MSRFNNLEFGDESQEHSPWQGALVKDESYYVSEARAAFENGEFEFALRLYSKVLEFNPQNIVAWAGQVRMLIELDEFKEARLWAEKALERFPHEPELLAAKAVALGREGDLEEALACSDAAVEQRGDTPYVWLARGDVLLARKEARADYCFDRPSSSPGTTRPSTSAARASSSSSVWRSTPWPPCRPTSSRAATKAS